MKNTYFFEAFVYAKDANPPNQDGIYLTEKNECFSCIIMAAAPRVLSKIGLNLCTIEWGIKIQSNQKQESNRKSKKYARNKQQLGYINTHIYTHKCAHKHLLGPVLAHDKWNGMGSGGEAQAIE